MKMNPVHLTQSFHDKKSLSPESVQDFQKSIYAHYHTNPRQMPWRKTRDPYRILVSEVMLQQTQVERVKTKYAEFLAAFPTLADLAAAPLSEVLLTWQGLGYNRRAIALKRCAEEIALRLEGVFPKTIAELETLPGIGPYTARAVATFAYGIVEPLIETNIRTVFIHFFFHGREQVSDQEIMPLVAATLDHCAPREWYYALMDYGVMLKRNHPNPGRRSAHHTRQSPFKGSNRELRSRILRAILVQTGITRKKLVQMLGVEETGVDGNLEALTREGFIVRSGKGYSVLETKKG